MPKDAYRFPYTLEEQRDVVTYLNWVRRRPAGWLLWSEERLGNYLASGLNEVNADYEKLRRGSRAEDHIYELLREGKRDGDQG